MASFNEILKKDIKLPSPPAIAVRILDAVRKDQSSFRDLARIISSDPALSAKILRVANSTLYSPRQPINTIEKSVSILGVDQLKNIALSFVIAQGMHGSTEETFNYDLFWRRAITSAVGAELVAKKIRQGSQDLFVTGLLMDLGIIVLYNWDQAGYSKVLDSKQISGGKIAAYEKRFIGVDHSEIGAELLKSWGLPEAIYEPVRYHHGGNVSPAYESHCEILQMANAVSSAYYGSRSSEQLILVKDILCGKYRMKNTDVDTLIDQVAETALDMLSSFEIEPGSLRPFSLILQEANEELGKLNLSYEHLIMELKQSRDRAERLARELEDANGKLREMAFRDGLTGLYNHRYFQDRLDQELANAVRKQAPLSLVLMDVDYFKSVNDRYGHPVGDQVLKALAARIDELTRRADVAARYGGEEFGVILLGTDARGLGVLAQRLRRGIEQLDIPTEAGVLKITVSIGTSSFDPEEGACDKGVLIDAADRALYQAKNSGRNQIVHLPMTPLSS